MQVKTSLFFDNFNNILNPQLAVWTYLTRQLLKTGFTYCVVPAWLKHYISDILKTNNAVAVFSFTLASVFFFLIKYYFLNFP